MLTLQVIACIGIITGAFLLFQIRLNDFTGNIFHRLLDAPKGIREEILEETKRRKKSYFRREIEEVQEILKTTDREELFPLLCTASLIHCRETRRTCGDAFRSLFRAGTHHKRNAQAGGKEEKQQWKESRCPCSTSVYGLGKCAGSLLKRRTKRSRF